MSSVDYFYRAWWTGVRKRSGGRKGGLVRTIGSGGDCDELQTICIALEREPPSSNGLLPGGSAGMLLPDCLKEEEEEEIAQNFEVKYQRLNVGLNFFKEFFEYCSTVHMSDLVCKLFACSF